MCNSNKKKDSKQVDLEGIEITDGYKWDFIGIFPANRLGLTGDEFFSVISNELGSKLPRKPKSNRFKVDWYWVKK